MTTTSTTENDTETIYLSAQIRTAPGKAIRAGWVPDADLVIALMTLEAADQLGRLLIRAAATMADPNAEQDLIHAAIDLFTSAARASFITGPNLTPVPKIDLPTSAADLDRNDQANVDPDTFTPGRATR